MADGEPGDPRVGDLFEEMARTISGTEVDHARPSRSSWGRRREQLNQLVSLRSQRLDYVEHGMPGVLWIALLVGAVVTVGFALLFGVERIALDWLLVGGLAALVGVLLLVAAVFDYPFAGDVSVGPDPFERVLVDFGYAPPGAGGD